jgi:C-terminal processing protease CtpA/Prc
MDIVGLTLQPAAGRWRVLGAAVEGIEPGDLLLRVDGLSASGATMGAVVDALRGTPGDVRVLTLERRGQRVRVEARVRRLM